jgi:hypothetical protein
VRTRLDELTGGEPNLVARQEQQAIVLEERPAGRQRDGGIRELGGTRLARRSSRAPEGLLPTNRHW